MDAHNVFRAHLFGLVVRGGVHFGPADHLRDAGVVAEIEEDQVAQIAAAVHPSGQEDGLAGVTLAKLAAVVGALAVAEKIEFHKIGGQGPGVRVS